MLTRQKVVNHYGELAKTAQIVTTQSDSKIEDLPPALCRLLAMQTRAGKMEHPFTAINDSALQWIRLGEYQLAIYLADTALPVMQDLPLQGHQVSANTMLNLGYIESGLQSLYLLDETKLAFVAEWTSMIVWVERSSAFAGQLLTSSTFPNFPHCTFLSLKSLQHIPPNNVLGFPSDYALAENLYHEALHQELAAWLLHQPVLSDNYHSRETDKIAVPWRGGAWEPDRVFHAIYVYSHLIPLRQMAMEKLTLQWAEKTWLKDALALGHEALAYLTREMQEHLDIFQPDSMGTVQRILSQASETIMAGSRRSL